ncbi:gtp-binding protein alpha subunit [Anaeramoeba flamelloides]|uniref:Gtp-binding protein alpha subunit n=1 Tax=Anaeramoeba flamelloides TaxID=1746091 RepID=A0AAV7ZJ85_9EUKA|nr:gtp-binding protein alpha subunit [Anaeramoeba flamelloides]
MGNRSRKKKKNKKEKQKEKTKNILIDLQMDKENEKIEKTIKIITLGSAFFLTNKFFSLSKRKQIFFINNDIKQTNSFILKHNNTQQKGTGESGKSTFLKQLAILYSTGFEESSRELYTSTIQKNLIHYIKILLRAAHSLGIKIQEENIRLSRTFFAFGDLTTQSLNAIIKLWSDPGLKEAYERRCEFQLPDMSKYFLDGAERIGKSDYLPTDQNILNCRIPTTGVNELNIVVDDLPWV